MGDTLPVSDQDNLSVNSRTQKRVRFLNDTSNRVEQLKSQCCSDCIVYHAKRQDKKIALVSPPQQKCSGDFCRSPDQNFTQTLEFSYAENQNFECLWLEISDLETLDDIRSDKEKAEVRTERRSDFSQPSEVVSFNLIALIEPKGITDYSTKCNVGEFSNDFDPKMFTQNSNLEPRLISLDSRSSSDLSTPQMTQGGQRLSRKKLPPNKLDRGKRETRDNFSDVNQIGFSRFPEKQNSTKLTWGHMQGQQELSPIRKMECRETRDRNLYRCSELFFVASGSEKWLQRDGNSKENLPTTQ